jgi:hypothetical protein
MKVSPFPSVLASKLFFAVQQYTRRTRIIPEKAKRMN